MIERRRFMGETGLLFVRSPFIGQAATPVEYHCPVSHPSGQAPGQAAFAVTYDPTLNCMRDARGNAICSDGMRYPPGCPHTPPDEYFTPGVTPDVTTGSRIEGQQPPPRAGAVTAAGGGSSIVPLAVGGGILAILGAGAYLLLR